MRRSNGWYGHGCEPSSWSATGRILSTALAYLLGASSSHFVWGDTHMPRWSSTAGTARITVVSLNQAPYLAEQVLP
jgi:hypothetical protein